MTGSAALGGRPAPRWWLSTLVFVSGAASLGTEMTGARLLAPYFGTSDLVWANVIGLILVSLSVGYWLGGRMADRHPNARALALVVMVAAAALAVIPFAARPLFDAAAHAFANVSAGAFVASFFGALAMFIVPVTALGAVAPWAIRLAVDDVGTTGSVAGRLYALSTVGSILGTFVPVLLLVPTIGTRRTMLVLAAALALAAAPALGRWMFIAAPAAVGLALLPQGHIKPATDGDRILFEGESAYQYVQVTQRTNGDRVLHLNEGWAVHSMLPARGILTGNYWDAFTALPPLAGGAKASVLVLGNAGGTVAHLFGSVWPQTTIDGVEIDPVVTHAARQYLGMDNPRLHVHTADARFCAYTFELENKTSRINFWDRTEKKLIELPVINDSPNAIFSPSMSADGNLIAFTALTRPKGAGAGYHVYLYDRTAKTMLDLPGLNSPVAEDRMAKISGDGRFIVFISNRKGGVGLTDIYLYDRKEAKLVDLPGLNSPNTDTEPALNHDGSLIAFASDRKGGMGGRDIYLYDRKAAKLIDLPGLNSEDQEHMPALSPDGRYLAFVSERFGGEGQRDIYLYDRKTAKLLATAGLNSKAEDFDPQVIQLKGE